MLELSLAFGRPINELRRSMTEAEFREYMAMVSIEPPLTQKLDWWLSQVMAALVNPYRADGAPQVQSADIKPDWWGERHEVNEGNVSTFVAWLAAKAGVQ